MDRKLLVGITPNFDDGRQHIPPRYTAAMEAVGAQTLMIPFEADEAALDELTDQLDGVLFSGGADVEPSVYGCEREPECGTSVPARDAMEKRLLPFCLKKKIPVLGICRGIQILNALLGGTLVQDVPSRYGNIHQMPGNAPSIFWHDVNVVPGTMLHALVGDRIPVDSYHHQCILDLAPGLVATAYAPEGFIEAVEMPSDKSFFMAVQWHPEVTFTKDENSRVIFERFYEAMEAFANLRR